MLGKAITTCALIGFALTQGLPRVHSHGGTAHSGYRSEPHFHTVFEAESSSEHSHGNAAEGHSDQFSGLGEISADEHDRTAIYFSSDSAYACAALKKCATSEFHLAVISYNGCPVARSYSLYPQRVQSGEIPSFSARELFLAQYSLRI